MSRHCSFYYANSQKCKQYTETPKCGKLVSIPAKHLASQVEYPSPTSEEGITLPGGDGVPASDLIVYVTAQTNADYCPESGMVTVQQRIFVFSMNWTSCVISFI